MHKVKVHELPAVVPQPQPVREMRHVVEHGGGHAAQVREVHRAGAQIQQHHRVDGCTLHCDVMSWSGRCCLPHVHESVRDVSVLTNTRACRSSSIKNVFVQLQCCVLPPLHTKLHHRHVHLSVRGEDLIAEERKNLHCDFVFLYSYDDGALD